MEYVLATIIIAQMVANISLAVWFSVKAEKVNATQMFTLTQTINSAMGYLKASSLTEKVSTDLQVSQSEFQQRLVSDIRAKERVADAPAPVVRDESGRAYNPNEFDFIS
jgi:hypothetical protein